MIEEDLFDIISGTVLSVVLLVVSMQFLLAMMVLVATGYMVMGLIAGGTALYITALVQGYLKHGKARTAFQYLGLFSKEDHEPLSQVEDRYWSEN